MCLKQYTKGRDIVDDPPGSFKNMETFSQIMGGIKLQSTNFKSHLKFEFRCTQTIK